MAQDYEALRNVSIFRELEDEELAGIWQLISVREVPAKECLVQEGSLMEQLCIVTDGVVHVRRMAQKHEMLLTRLGPGGFFGEVNLFDPGNATASVYAMKRTQLVVFSHQALRDYFGAHPATGYKVVSAIMREMARRLRLTNSRLVHSAFWAPSANASEG